MGKVLKIVGIVVLVLVVLIVVVGFYFYNFYVFKTLRFCIGEGADSEIQCNFTQDCVDLIVEQGIDVDLDNAPDFMKENFYRIVDESVYCDETCFIKNIRGVNPETRELEVLESCNNKEVELLVEIHARDGIEVWKYMKDRE